MSRKYKLRPKRIRDENGEEKVLYYPISVAVSTFTTDEIAKEISDASSLTESDVSGALKAFSTIIIQKLRYGHNVKLDGIGTFSLSVRGEGVENPEDFKASMVRVGKVAFKSDIKLRESLEDTKFNKVD